MRQTIMASKSMFVCVACLVVLCFMLLKNASACNSGQNACFIAKASPERRSRKVLGGLMVKKSGAVISGNVNREFNAWELRKVPSGPDPLHHNGNTPKKPRSP